MSRRARAYVATVAPRGHALGATARISVDLAVTADGTTRPVTLTGRLLLTPVGSQWRVFGYDLALGGARAAGGQR